jgi:outer membrane protein assembly factor BamA
MQTINSLSAYSKVGKSPFPLLLFLLGFLVSSCSVTKNIPEGQYLLDKAEVVIEDEGKGIREGELNRYIRQKPNKRVLMFRLHLRLFNLANPQKEKGISGMLRKIGEEPVVLDTFQTHQTSINLSKYLESKGYYSAKVSDTTKLGKRRATVKYNISPGSPHRIRNIKYVIEDSLISSIVFKDTINRVFKRGNRFDIELLREERNRIEKVLREEGYFFFSSDYISFTADTSVNERKVDLDLVIRNRFFRNEFGERIPQRYQKYEISNVYIYTNYDPVEFFYLEKENFLDTLSFDNQQFVYSLNTGVRLKTVSNANLIRPGQVYSGSMVQKTRDNLNSLRLFRAVNVFFREDESADSTQRDDFLLFNEGFETDSLSLGKLNCYIQLTPHTLQSYQVDLVGTNTASDVGVEGNLSYQHKNIFRGAEIFDTKLRGMVQFLSGEQFSTSSYELGGSVGLNFPRFLGPFAGQEYQNRYAPKTQVTASYNFQYRPEYTRTVAGMNYSYTWRSENRFTHTFTPIELNVINLLAISDDFWQKIKDRYEANSYKNQLVTLTGYSFIYSNQSASKRNYSVLRYNFEVSGNVLNALFDVMGREKVDGAYQIFNTNFSQYARTDINYVFNHIIDENNSVVYRVYSGVGLPYGNSAALPFEKKYFSGGSTGVRAWNARGLGPGSYIEEQLQFPNQTADIKFEANVEYRFNLVWLLEGALFLDAGNIWSISPNEDRPGAVFSPNTFYKEIALGTGTGIRMNLGFFTIRFDMGLKLYDPGIISVEDGEFVYNYDHWIPFDRSYNRDDIKFHFGIGYPF